MPRMRILTSTEQHALETPPQLNAAQRKHAFDLPLALQKEASSLRDQGHQIAFCLNAGYFRHLRRCFDPNDFPPRDVAYVAAKLGCDASAFNPAGYSQRSLHRHRRSIEELCGFRPWGQGDAAKLDERISASVLGHERTKAIFYDCLAWLVNEKVAAPSYRTIQDLILASIACNRARQAALIEAHLSESVRTELDALMGLTETADGARRFKLTALKRHSQSVKPTAVKARLANHAQLAALFHKVEPIIAILGWEEASLQAYAAAVIKYDLHDLRRRKAADRYLHLIAFVAFQFYTLQDNLVATLLTSVKAAQNTASQEHKDWCYSERKSQATKLQARIEAFESHFQGAMAQLQAVFKSGALTDTEKLESLQLMLFPIDTQPILSNALLKGMKEEVSNSDRDDAQYFTILESRSRALQNRVSGLLKSLIFNAESNSKPLFSAIKNFQKNQGNIAKAAPVAFLIPAERAAVGKGANFRPSLYKILLFQHVSEAIKSGSVNLPQSQKYRALDGYMIEPDDWKRNRGALLKQADMEQFDDPKVVLSQLRLALDRQFAHTNENIKEGKNLGTLQGLLHGRR